MAAQKYVQKAHTVEAIQFDGENGEEIVKFVGGEDYGKVSGDEVELSLQGKDPRSPKVTVTRGQWVSKSKVATSVVNEGEFAATFEKEDGGEIAPLKPAKEEKPVPEDELVYQPGYAPLSEEEKKEKEKKDKEEKEKKEKKEKEEHQQQKFSPVRR
jgi:hypothetical protein